MLTLDASGYVSPTYGTVKTFAPGAEEPTSLAEVLRDTVPAQAYGAKCDGATDDSRAFAKAQAVAGSGTVLWSAGTCILDAVTLANGISHVGAPGGKTVWRRKANSTANIFVSSAYGAHHVILRDLVIDGNRSAQTMGANNLQFIGGPYALTLERVTSRGAKAVNGYGSGYLVFDGADITRNTSTRILASQFVDNDGGGIEVQGGGNYQVDLTEASRNGKTGIKFDKAAPPRSSATPTTLRSRTTAPSAMASTASWSPATKRAARGYDRSGDRRSRSRASRRCWETGPPSTGATASASKGMAMP